MLEADTPPSKLTPHTPHSAHPNTHISPTRPTLTLIHSHHTYNKLYTQIAIQGHE